MNTLVIVGGSRGIGNSILKNQIGNKKIINLSRTKPELTHQNLSHHTVDILVDDLPELETVNQLVYCPGSINLQPITRLDLDAFKQDFEINVLGAIKTIQAYLPKLKASSNASVLLFSTVATQMGMPYHSSVAVAKSGVEGLIKSLAAEYAAKIRFNAIAPTITDTDLAAKILRNEKTKENMKERHPLKRYLNTDEVAHLANYLLSHQSASISGQIFQMDCGITTLKL